MMRTTKVSVSTESTMTKLTWETAGGKGQQQGEGRKRVLARGGSCIPAAKKATVLTSEMENTKGGREGAHLVDDEGGRGEQAGEGERHDGPGGGDDGAVGPQARHDGVVVTQACRGGQQGTLEVSCRLQAQCRWLGWAELGCV